MTLSTPDHPRNNYSILRCTLLLNFQIALYMWRCSLQDRTRQNLETFYALVIPHCGRISTLAVQRAVSSDSVNAASGCLCRGLAVAATEARRHEVSHAAGLKERRALGREEVLDEPRQREDKFTRVDTARGASQRSPQIRV